jgi:hypothetical protein
MVSDRLQGRTIAEISVRRHWSTRTVARVLREVGALHLPPPGRETVHAALRVLGEATARELCESTGYSDMQLRTILAGMTARGEVVSRKVARASRWRLAV